MINRKWHGFMPLEKTCLLGVAHARLMSKNVVDNAANVGCGNEGYQRPHMSHDVQNSQEPPPAIGWLTELYMWEQ